MNVHCENCKHVVDEYALNHWTEGHEGLCCDCMELSCGAPLHSINMSRVAAGKLPIAKPWPGLDEHGNRIT